MHTAARRYVASHVLGRRWNRVVEIGGRNVNGGIRDLVAAADYTSLDLAPGPDVDVVADCRTWQPPQPVDLVLCCEVLEHAPDPAGVVAAAISYLGSGGRLVLTCAGPGRAPHSGYHGGPLADGEHYANVDPEDLLGWCGALRDVDLQRDPDACDVHLTGVRP
jgi:hypothetical protein